VSLQCSPRPSSWILGDLLPREGRRREGRGEKTRGDEGKEGKKIGGKTRQIGG